MYATEACEQSEEHVQVIISKEPEDMLEIMIQSDLKDDVDQICERSGNIVHVHVKFT